MATSTVWADAFISQGGLFCLSPDRFLVFWGDFRWSEKYDPDHTSFYAPDFYLSKAKPWLIPQTCVEMSRDEIHRMLRGFPEEHRDIQWENPNFGYFESDFSSIQQGIESGRLKKAVPVVFESGKANIDSKFRVHLLKNLLKMPKAIKSYGYWDANQGMLGGTPETLFIKKNRYDLFTMALAGTLPKGKLGLARRSLLEDAKELYEHRIVIRDIVERFQELGQVEVSRTHILNLPTLDHLETDIAVHLQREMELEEAVRLLHPTPALGIAPRKDGMSFLKGLHYQEERNHFGAPFGVRLPDGQVFCVVAIRNVQWDAGNIRIGSGCGVVRSSQVDREWVELKAKRESVKKMLGL